MMPSKKAIIASVLGAAVVLLAYNKIPQVKKLLGG